MELASVQMFSRALGRHVTYSLILPDGRRHGPGPYPVLYQLHGRSDDHTAWIVRSRLVDHVAPYGLIVVLPDGGLSGWRNAGPHERYEDFLTVDLPAHLAACFRVRPGRAAIGGLSMGGGGALRLALKHPDLYASAWGHSSALPTAAAMRAEGLGDAEAEAEDVYRLTQHLMERWPRCSWPRLGFDCGQDDFLLAHSRAYHAYLQALAFPHAYHEHPGAHTWEYWDAHVPEALRQHAQVLGITRH